jgi:flagellar basal-body rod protein FlgG
MNDAIGAITSALHDDAEAVRVISLNVANAQTPGYRREIAVSPNSFATDIDAHARAAETAVDIRSGTLKSTSEPLSLAIAGKGFFVLSTAQGELLTRRGDFRLDQEGRIVTQDGDPVLGVNGPITVTDQHPVVASDGTVKIGDTVVDRLRIVEVGPGATLSPAGNGALRLSGGELADGSASQVQQGFIETSNVQPVNETIQLMQTMRHFETAQRFVRGYDGMMDDAINLLGKI